MADILTDLATTRSRFEAAVRALNFEAASVAWHRIDILLDRYLAAATAAMVKQ